jgi:SAM-dependent methyltransferase
MKSIDILVQNQMNKLQTWLAEQRVRNILASKISPQVYDDEAVFQTLMAQYAPPPEYGYDPYSTWVRGMERAQGLLKQITGLRESPKRTLELACGDGMVSAALMSYGHDVTVMDMDDWRDSRARACPFVRVNVDEDDLSSFCSGSDLVFSYNSFEHFAKPDLVFEKILTCVKPGGWIFLSFGPLYAGPYGLHAYRSMPMPFPQYLFSEEFIDQKLAQLGIRDLGKDLQKLQPLNGWLIRQFDKLWNSDQVSIQYYKREVSKKYLKIIQKYPAAFQGRNLYLEDVTTLAVHVLLQRK